MDQNWQVISGRDDSTVVRNVRGRIADRSDRFGADTYDPAELAYAWPEDNGGLRYALGRSADRECVGVVEADHGRFIDTVQFYLLASFCDGTTLEMLRDAGSLDVTYFFKNGEQLAEVATTIGKPFKFFSFSYAQRWDIRTGDNLIGTVRRGYVVRPGALSVAREGKPSIPLATSRQDRILDFFKIVGRILTFPIWLRRPVPPNDDLVVPRAALEAAKDVPIWLHIAISLFFRMHFRGDFMGIGD